MCFHWQAFNVIAQYLGAFTPTLTLPLDGGGCFLNDFNQLIPSPQGERVRVRGGTPIY